VKDLALMMQGGAAALPKALDKYTQSSPGNGGTPWYKDPKTLIEILGGGALGLGGLALASRGIGKETRPNYSMVKVELPTRYPGDPKTTVEIPMDQFPMPQNLYHAVARDTRRHLREDSKERAWKRGPGGHLITNAEPYDEDLLDAAPIPKMASVEPRASFESKPVKERLMRTVNYLLSL
jgi:hypothetical protein